MRSGAGVVLALALLAGGCGASASKCPKPIVYDEATLKKIEKAREALPKDSILLQVLEEMHGTGADAVSEFSRSAAVVLTRRVKNSPAERKESRWLSGWIKRVNSYSRG